MSKITPHLWFDKEAKEASTFYASLLPDSQVSSIQTIHGTPSGDCDIVSFTMAGQPFMAISAGPYFKINPSISFFINFDPSRNADASKQIDEVWNKLAEGGTALMPMQEYPFSKRYGWMQDRYGTSWQLILTDPAGEERPTIVPSLLFVNDKCGKAEEASDFYLSIFSGSKRGTVARYPAGMAPDKEGALMFTDFKLLDTWMAAMDSAHEHKFSFNEAISFIVKCDTQKEIDYYWEKLSAVPSAEQCGWLKDKYGVSWQIVPSVMDEMMAHGTKEQVARVTELFLKMKKFIIADLEKAYEK
jgi:predicted 3-demethylubiquinone-9 3-methyltransferase (glyoxalase superfamily)